MNVPTLEPARAIEIVERLPLAVALLDIDNRIAWTNPRFDELFEAGGLAAAGLLDCDPAHYSPPRRLRVPGRNSKDIDVLAHCRHAAAQFRMLVLDDTAEHVESERIRELSARVGDLERDAMVDRLTGAWNRRYLDHALTTEMNRSRRYRQPLAGVLIDIDHFKQVNDKFGHQAGDAVLHEMVGVMRGGSRAADTLVRWGGEEFLLLMPYTAHGAAAAAAEKLRALIEAHRFTPAGTMTASFGVAEYLGGDDADAFFARLDRALYAAKNGGRNRVATDGHGASDAWGAGGDGIVQLVWNERYACGDPVIDGEHEELFRLANDVIEASMQQEGDRFATALERCLRHVEHHFRHEEAILLERGYTKLVQHKESHRTLLARGAALKLAAPRGEVTTGTLVEFLANEVVSRHMLAADRDYHPLFATPP